MSSSDKSLQETLDEGLENFWKILDRIIGSTSKRPRKELDEAIMRLERRLKEGVNKKVGDTEEKKSKILQIEVMISEIRNNLDRILEVKADDRGEKKKLKISGDSKDSQKKLDEYPDSNLESFKEKINSLDF